MYHLSSHPPCEIALLDNGFCEQCRAKRVPAFASVSVGQIKKMRRKVVKGGKNDFRKCEKPEKKVTFDLL